jgi:hypothetical protein
MIHPIKLLFHRGGKIKLNNKVHTLINNNIKRVIPHLKSSSKNIHHSLKKLSLGSGPAQVKLPEIISEYDNLPMPPHPAKLNKPAKLKPIKFKR